METKLNHWYNDENKIYTRDSWTIPEEGTEVWSTAWKRGQTIKPYGDGCHVFVGVTAYHCDEFMGILKRLEAEGFKWGIDVPMEREQYINGKWVPVNVLTIY